jgi:hypothetical protein
MPDVRCIHPDCAARMPRRVNFCPACGARQSVEAPRAVSPPQRPAARAAPATTAPMPAARTPAPPVPARQAGRRSGIGFWIVALALMFSVWLSFSDDKKAAPAGKMRQNASQDQRK